MIKRRESLRKKNGAKRRYNSASYRMWARISGAVEDLSTFDRTVDAHEVVKNEISSCGDGPPVTVLGKFEPADRIANPRAQNLVNA